MRGSVLPHEDLDTCEIAIWRRLRRSELAVSASYLVEARTQYYYAANCDECSDDEQMPRTLSVVPACEKGGQCVQQKRE